MRYFDALDLASNPTGAVPLEPQEAVVDDCGRFRASNLPRATLGFIAIAIDDPPGVTPAEPHRATGVVFANQLGSEPNDVRAYATRVATDQLWTTSAGLTGSTFAERGVLLKVFVHQDQPVAGIGARRNGAAVPDDDFYFSDAGRTRRTVDPARSATGPNGSVLVINGPSPTAHDGAGGEPTGCVRPETLGAAVPGVVFVDVVEAQTLEGAACPVSSP
ncbi:MAG: hypothetical protein K8M05_17010 [Deltaproteobacteria bacterium]|nr:hypothetical protein [Kofleriaceae bacterium]